MFPISQILFLPSIVTQDVMSNVVIKYELTVYNALSLPRFITSKLINSKQFGVQWFFIIGRIWRPLCIRVNYPILWWRSPGTQWLMVPVVMRTIIKDESQEEYKLLNRSIMYENKHVQTPNINNRLSMIYRTQWHIYYLKKPQYIFQSNLIY